MSDVDLIDKRLTALEAQSAELLQQFEQLSLELKALQGTQTVTIPQPTDWEIYTCAKCDTTQCEYMYDEYNMNGQCRREDEKT